MKNNHEFGAASWPLFKCAHRRAIANMRKCGINKDGTQRYKCRKCAIELDRKRRDV